MRGPRWSLAGLLVAGAVVTVAPQPAGPAHASCVGPQLQVAGTDPKQPVVPKRVQVRIEGKYFVAECNDTPGSVSDPGCHAQEQPEAAVTPRDNVRLVLKQDGQTWQLGIRDADKDGDVAWNVVLPRGVRLGRATLRAAPSQKLVVTIQR